LGWCPATFPSPIFFAESSGLFTLEASGQGLRPLLMNPQAMNRTLTAIAPPKTIFRRRRLSSFSNLPPDSPRHFATQALPVV
jgi:hypothetical protein